MYACCLEAKEDLCSFGEKIESIGTKRRLLQNPCELIIEIALPTLVCFGVIRMYISRLRYKYALFVIISCTIVPMILTAVWTRHNWKLIRRGRGRRANLALNAIMWFALIFACLKGDTIFWRFSRSYYQFDDLASYINISPSTDMGQSYMDAGQVYFKEGTRVEVTKAMAYQEDQIYCVAPIVQESLDAGGDSSASQAVGGNTGKGGLKLPKSGTVDFWAVGLNCCDPSGLNFKCGDATNLNARAGIRALRDDTRPFFLMAVQEWTAWLRLPAKHPLFFHWVQDPLYEVEKMWYQGKLHWIFDTFSCGVLSTIGIIGLHVLLYNMGF